MLQLLYYLCAVLMLFLPKDNALSGETAGYAGTSIISGLEEIMTPMEALDLVKELYADNYEKVIIEDSEDNSYYYKLPEAGYYLEYEGSGETEQSYLIRLYEFVEDDPELGIGHTVTYGWYTVDRITGAVIDKIEY